MSPGRQEKWLSLAELPGSAKAKDWKVSTVVGGWEFGAWLAFGVPQLLVVQVRVANSDMFLLLADCSQSRWMEAFENSMMSTITAMVFAESP